MTTLAFAITALRWRWATRRAARAAWHAGTDVITWMDQVMASAAETIWPEPGSQTPCPNPSCGGRHCKGCEEPARIIADDTGWTARHVPEELPPSLVDAVMLWASPVDRARVASRHIRTRWAPRMLRNAVLQDPQRWAQRLGRAPQIGTMRLAGRLP